MKRIPTGGTHVSSRSPWCTPLRPLLDPLSVCSFCYLRWLRLRLRLRARLCFCLCSRDRDTLRLRSFRPLLPRLRLEETDRRVRLRSRSRLERLCRRRDGLRLLDELLPLLEERLERRVDFFSLRSFLLASLRRRDLRKRERLREGRVRVSFDALSFNSREETHGTLAAVSASTSVAFPFPFPFSFSGSFPISVSFSISISDLSDSFASNAGGDEDGRFGAASAVLVLPVLLSLTSPVAGVAETMVMSAAAPTSTSPSALNEAVVMVKRSGSGSASASAPGKGVLLSLKLAPTHT
jgi:hypothetical protein